MSWAPDYITTEEYKGFSRLDDPIDDVEIALYITASARAIDRHTNRQFGNTGTATDRLYVASPRLDRGRWVLVIDDTMDDDLTVTTAAGEATDYRLEPANAADEGKPWTRLVFGRDEPNVPTVDDLDVTVRTVWGWSAVPSAVKLASRLQTSRFAARRDSPFGIAGSPDQGNELRLLARLDPDVAVSLGAYVRPRRAR
jgi:hypothetical protein